MTAISNSCSILTSMLRSGACAKLSMPSPVNPEVCSGKIRLSLRLSWQAGHLYDLRTGLGACSEAEGAACTRGSCASEGTVRRQG